MKRIATIDDRTEVGALASMSARKFFGQMQGYQADAGTRRLTARMEFGSGAAMLCALGRPHLAIGHVNLGENDEPITTAVREAARSKIAGELDPGPTVVTVLFDDGTAYVGTKEWIDAIEGLFNIEGL